MDALPVELRRELHDIGVEHFRLSNTQTLKFFRQHASEIARACAEMADRFSQGGRLVAFGSGAWASDANHVAVEFVHPVILGKKALPALALSEPWTRQLEQLCSDQDIALGLGPGAAVSDALQMAREQGMLTLGINAQSGQHFDFSPPSECAQELGEHLYHLLWELVHVQLESHGQG